MSLFDDLKEGSSEQEFDLNIVLCGRNDSNVTYLDLVDDPTGEIFCLLKDCRARRSQVLVVGDKEEEDTCLISRYVLNPIPIRGLNIP